MRLFLEPGLLDYSKHTRPVLMLETSVKPVLWWEEAVRMQRTKQSDLTKEGYFQTVALQSEKSQIAGFLWPS